MLHLRRVVLPLRAMLVAAFLLLVVFETLALPGQFAHDAKEHPEDAHLRWPATVIAVAVLVCVQVVIVATWKLLTRVVQDRIFSEGAFVWVDTIIGAIAVAWTLLAGTSVYVVLNADDPGAPMLLLLLLVAGAVVGLLMVVMRGLLRQATTLRSDMDAVI